MNGVDLDAQTTSRLGEAWIDAVMQKDFQDLTGLCQPDVRSRLMTPRRITELENASDLSLNLKSWFGDCTSIQKEQSRVALVGEKLAIFYRLLVIENGEPYITEQQLYCSLRDDRIDQLSLLCSGFQPVWVPITGEVNTAAQSQPPASSLPILADAFLNINTGGGRESTCAILTPSIKRKLVEMESGQVLEVRVDDPTVNEDIESWCRLSGNLLLKLDQVAGQELRFYVKKK